MSKRMFLGLVAIVSTSLPTTLVSAEEKEKTATPVETAVSLCVRMRELVFECKEDFADAFVAMRNPPPEQRAAMRKTALQEITTDGSGPLPPRRQACEGMGRAGGNLGKDWLADAQKKLDGCAAVSDCKARVPCIQALMRPPGRAKPSK